LLISLALIDYLLCKDVKRSLSDRLSPREALAWLMSAQRAFAVGEWLCQGGSKHPATLASDDAALSAPAIVATLSWLGYAVLESAPFPLLAGKADIPVAQTEVRA
jgi:hypothetical protein